MTNNSTDSQSLSKNKQKTFSPKKKKEKLIEIMNPFKMKSTLDFCVPT